jgi:hypothetical protein
VVVQPAALVQEVLQGGLLSLGRAQAVTVGRFMHAWSVAQARLKPPKPSIPQS